MTADLLYGLPLDRFIAERTALARALRAEGKRDEAAEVMRIRKPSIAAWVVNQLVRTQPRAVCKLWEAGDAVREAQQAMLAGRADGRTLRAAAESERTAVDGLVKAARELLSSQGQGISAAIIERVADTLHAAALDDGARAQVGDGRLERELRHAGLGTDAGLSLGPVPVPAAVPAAVPVVATAQRARPATERKSAEARERKRAAARKAAHADEADARRRAERAGRALKVAEERCERAAQALGDAQDALGTARAEAKTAADAHRRAEQQRTRLDG